MSVSAKELSLTIYTADCCGNAGNCLYPHTKIVSTPETMKDCVSQDHVLVEFSNGYRSKENFRCATVATFDCDNDHSDDPNAWIKPEDLDSILYDVKYITYTSRNNMKQKGEKSPRPRYHVICFIDKITNANNFTAFMKKVQSTYPFFDSNALDAGRFFYGNPDAEIQFHPGTQTLTQHMAELESERSFAELEAVIPEGKRNATLSHFAGRIIKRLGDTNDAYDRYIEEAEKCNPPLEDTELNQIWRSAQSFYKKVQAQPGYVSPEAYDNPSVLQWETPIPFDEYSLPDFPVDSLPTAIRNYVLAVAESTQTPVEMGASAALAIMALCMQGNYRIRGKADWTEPMNLFVVIVAEPSERKSAILSFMTRPVNEFESEYNRQNAAGLESSKMNKRILERRQRALEDKAAKGKTENGELDKLAQEISDFKEATPLRLYVDDVTTEKLTSVLANGNGKAAIVSAEGGIFDMLSGIYTKNVNIDVMLKGHSGDCIRVDRIGRNSESIMNPALTILLMVQPNVLSGMMQNGTFRGRGLTARFLYCIPESIVGKRKYRTKQIPAEVSREYDMLIQNLLKDEQEQATEILLSPEADHILESFAEDLEPKLNKHYTDIADWAGKLVGTILRIAGVLCRASSSQSHDFLSDPEALVVDATTMENAISIGNFFTEHSKAAFSLMGADTVVKQCQYVLSAISKSGLLEFNRRDIMRLCRTFKTAEAVQPVLNHLIDYGYIAPKNNEIYSGKGRPTTQTYLVNPCIYEKVS